MLMAWAQEVPASLQNLFRLMFKGNIEGCTADSALVEDWVRLIRISEVPAQYACIMKLSPLIAERVFARVHDGSPSPESDQTLRGLFEYLAV